ncbi:MAG: phosphoribosyltransferase [Candidatus Omnitrophica bacterium]|nr:phosphoribosyltransferase [Candidatus Omnitrophota bacterium]
MKKIDFSTIMKMLNEFDFPDVDMVVGIGFGGLVPAALVAQRLGKDLSAISINYRDAANTPQHDQPRLLKPLKLPAGVKKILLVDDVAVTGQTLMTARAALEPCEVVTFVLKGKADLVLLPLVKDCVLWPWK